MEMYAKLPDTMKQLSQEQVYDNMWLNYFTILLWDSED